MGGVAVVAAVALAVLSVRCVLAVNYVVGDASCLWNYGCDYDRWALKYNFVKGDILEFRFVEGDNTVALLSSKLDYDVCGPLSMTTVIPHSRLVNSPAKFPLTSAGTYYFASIVQNICLQKLAVTVTAAAATTSVPMEDYTVPASSSTSTSAPYRRRSASSGSSKTALEAVLGLMVVYVLVVAKLSLIVYCVIQRRRQRQLLLETLAALPNETSPVLHDDGQNHVYMDAQGGYVPHGVDPESNYRA